jgi:hypothetical protein
MNPGFPCQCFLSLLAAALLACGSDDGSPARTATDSTEAATAHAGSSSDDAGIVCKPGEQRCNGALLETCAATGLDWDQESCGDNRVCTPCEGTGCTTARCLGPCESDSLLPSSAGCSFIVNRQLHLVEDGPDGIIVANPNRELLATVQIYKVPEGRNREEEDGEPFSLAPGDFEVIEVDTSFVLGTSSMFRTGGMLRIESDAPVIAYHHAPLRLDVGNDSSMLLPEQTLRNDYVVFSYNPHPASHSMMGRPTYFEIIGLENQTSIEWTPPVQTSGNGLPIKPVMPGETGALKINRFDTVRITAARCPDDECPSSLDPVANLQDVSGTVIRADKPIWVVGASRCSRVPVRESPVNGRCDPLQEQLIPIDYWGREYVAAPAPQRETERHYWRIYSGREDVTVETDPPQTGTPHTFSSIGEYIELDVSSGTAFMINSTGPVMPVLYLQSRWTLGEPEDERTMYGDPAMTQSVPVAQFLDRYVFVTPLHYTHNYVQVIRRVGSADVHLDGMLVTGYYQVGDFEVSDVAISEGGHTIESDGPFGILQVGYSGDEPDPDNCPDIAEGFICNTSYAYPGGMKSEQIFVP